MTAPHVANGPAPALQEALSAQPPIDASGLAVSYGNRPVFSGANFSVAPAEFVAVPGDEAAHPDDLDAWALTPSGIDVC